MAPKKPKKKAQSKAKPEERKFPPPTKKSDDWLRPDKASI
jgi:hypothetical protein